MTVTRIIDIEARALERDTYRPLFRLTEIDRRRERKVVRMPNDGPGMTWDERMALSQAALERINRPKFVRQKGDEQRAPDPCYLAQAHARTRAMIRAILDGAVTSADVARAIGENDYVTRHVIDRAVLKGLIAKGTKGEARTVTGHAASPLFITAAGLTFLKGGVS